MEKIIRRQKNGNIVIPDPLIPLEGALKDMERVQHRCEAISDHLYAARSKMEELITGNAEEIKFYEQIREAEAEPAKKPVQRSKKRSSSKAKPKRAKTLRGGHAKRIRSQAARGGAHKALSRKDALKVRSLVRRGSSQLAVSKKFGVSTFVVHNAVHKKGAYA